jgi:hypothetical protein
MGSMARFYKGRLGGPSPLDRGIALSRSKGAAKYR